LCEWQVELRSSCGGGQTYSNFPDKEKWSECPKFIEWEDERKELQELAL
jgi:hypothetical protein